MALQNHSRDHWLSSNTGFNNPILDFRQNIPFGVFGRVPGSKDMYMYQQHSIRITPLQYCEMGCSLELRHRLRRAAIWDACYTKYERHPQCQPFILQSAALLHCCLFLSITVVSIRLAVQTVQAWPHEKRCRASRAGPADGRS